MIYIFESWIDGLHSIEYHMSMDLFPEDFKFITNGITTFLERGLEAYFRPISATMDRIVNKDRYLILYVKEGDGTLILPDGHNLYYGGPSVLLFDHRVEEMVWNQGHQNEGFLLYFHPCLVNTRLSFDVINNFTHPSLSISDWRDLYMLEGFHGLSERGFYQHPLNDYINIRLDSLGKQLEETLVKQSVEKWPCFSRSYIFELLITLQMIDEKSRVDAKENNLDSLKELEIFIHSNYNKPMTLNSIASRFNTNRSSLSERFRLHYGITLRQYIIQYRLNVASSLLVKTALTVQEICHRVGYSDSSNFNKQFKDQFSLTPGKFRKKRWAEQCKLEVNKLKHLRKGIK